MTSKLSEPVNNEFKGREFEFNDSDFSAIKSAIYDKSGINLTDNKKSMVYARLSKRIRQLNLNTFAEYVSFLSTSSDEKLLLVDMLTTNVTSFFRENHHFQEVKDNIDELRKVGQLPETLTIWSAGCSSGQEPYSIAITLNQHFGKNSGFKIHATDISPEILGKAQRGVYDINEVKNIDQALLKKYFMKGGGQNSNRAKVKDFLKDNIQFSILNLMEPIHFDCQFDVIFCRNVIIYFDKETKVELLKKYHALLKPNGLLMLGHSENIFGVESYFKSCGKTVFRKVQPGEDSK